MSDCRTDSEPRLLGNLLRTEYTTEINVTPDQLSGIVKQHFTGILSGQKPPVTKIEVRFELGDERRTDGYESWTVPVFKGAKVKTTIVV